MKKVFLIFILSWAWSFTILSNIDYAVDNIPAELKENAVAVVRFESGRFILNSIKKAEFKVKKAITILNKNGDDQGYLKIFYDKFRKINSIKAKVFDQYGELIKQIPPDEIYDKSAVSGSILYSDTRRKAIYPDVGEYPFTVEYEYEVSFKGLLQYPEWNFIPDYHVSVQESHFTLSFPEHMNIRYHLKNLNDEKNTHKEDGRISYGWSKKNLPAYKKEPFSSNIDVVAPVISIAPTVFEIEGYEGNMETWEDFGKWIQKLNEGKNNLPPETVAEIKELIKDVPSDQEKIRILYEYMQKKTRYVSIQIGIGGWQPFDAAEVDKNSYGDCKALSNYMCSLLEIAGITSHYTLVKAGSNASPILKDFPSNQFNHAIVCVPSEKDTIWLECTNQYSPYGFLGDFTDNRYVLIIDESGGKLVKTKSYKAEENTEIRKVNVILDEQGNGTAKATTFYSGISYDMVFQLNILSPEEVRKKLYQRINIPSFTLNHFQYNEKKDIIPVMEETLDLSLNKYAKTLGDRLILKLDIMNSLNFIPERIEDRKTEIVFRRPFIKIDSVHYKLPQNFIIDKLPEEITHSSEFGTYKMNVIQDNEDIIYVRNFTMNNGNYPMEEYDAFIEFFEKINKADNTKIILKKVLP